MRSSTQRKKSRRNEKVSADKENTDKEVDNSAFRILESDSKKHSDLSFMGLYQKSSPHSRRMTRRMELPGDEKLVTPTSATGLYDRLRETAIKDSLENTLCVEPLTNFDINIQHSTPLKYEEEQDEIQHQQEEPIQAGASDEI